MAYRSCRRPIVRPATPMAPGSEPENPRRVLSPAPSVVSLTAAPGHAYISITRFVLRKDYRRCNWSRPLPRPLTIPDLLTLETLGDVAHSSISIYRPSTAPSSRGGSNVSRAASLPTALGY